MLNKGILTALSSDAPVVKDFNPLKGMEAAITRCDNDGNVIGAGEAISIKEALKGYTSSAAAISQLDDYGSIEEGNAADFILINRSPLETSAADLTKLHVEKTFVTGRLVWSRDKTRQ